MSQNKQKKIAAIAVTVLVLITGVAFLFAVLHLYFTGDAKPYSRELVGKYLTFLTIPSALTLAAVIYSGVLSLIFPEGEGGVRVSLTEVALKRLTGKLALDKCEEKTKEAILAERKKRVAFSLVSLTMTIVYTVLSLILALDFSRYEVEGHNADIIGVVLIILPLAVLVIGIITLLLYLFSISRERELALVKAAIKDGAVKDGEAAVACEKCCPIKTFAQKNGRVIALCSKIAVFAVAVLFIVLGIFNGGMADVIGKAVRICTECIGLG